VFEPLTNDFAARALDLLDLRPGLRLIDIAAGAGGTALMAAARGAEVLAIDAAAAMVARAAARATAAALPIKGAVMDGMALALPDARFDVAVSVFGVILFPDTTAGMREIARVLRPNGRVAIVTWTQPERYELAARLIAAARAVRGPPSTPPPRPAQLRFCEETALRDLVAGAGLRVDAVEPLAARWHLPSARWIAERLAFAPGLAAMLASLGRDSARVIDAFVTALERDQGASAVALEAVAHVAVGCKLEASP
jgi:SAM-dependent methyltransferase